MWLFYFTVYWKYRLFTRFSADGLHNWGILLVIPLELQGIKHQPFPIIQPFVSYGEYTFLTHSLPPGHHTSSLSLSLSLSRARAFLRLCHSMWLFHIHRMVNIQIFYPLFPLAESIANVFFFVIPLEFQEKSINPFYATAISYNLPAGARIMNSLASRAHNTDTIYLLSSFLGYVVILYITIWNYL